MAPSFCPADCMCHTGPYAACNVPGGCGTAGCGRTVSGCVLCPIYRPDTDPRLPDRPPVCEGDRSRLPADLHDVATLHTVLANPEPPPVDDRWYTAVDQQGHPYQLRADPLAAVGGGAPVPGKHDQPPVSGSREAPVPANLTHLDLTAPNRPGTVNIRYAGNWSHQPGGDPDQIGHLSVATELDWWVRDWRDTLWPDHHLPPATVGHLVDWLAVRVDEACTRHPAIDEFAAKIRQLRGVLRAAAGESEAPPTVMLGVPCKQCDTVSQLVQDPGDKYIRCDSCGLLYTRTEYDHWVRLVAGHARTSRTRETAGDTATCA